MCTLHLFFQVFPDAPLVFAANRDETLDRPWRTPERLSRVPPIYGPRDLTAGGTWLGVNEAGVLASLANHRGTLREGSKSLCSRGTVVLETLRHGSAREAHQFAEWVSPVCKAYTLLVADPSQAYVIDHGANGTQTYRLMPGCHVITNERFRDANDAKAAHRLEQMEKLADRPTVPSSTELFSFLADHTVAGTDTTALCVHPEPGSNFGTSSASVVRVDPNGSLIDFLMADGPPCCTPFADYTEAAISPRKAL